MCCIPTIAKSVLYDTIYKIIMRLCCYALGFDIFCSVFTSLRLVRSKFVCASLFKLLKLIYRLLLLLRVTANCIGTLIGGTLVSSWPLDIYYVFIVNYKFCYSPIKIWLTRIIDVFIGQRCLIDYIHPYIMHHRLLCISNLTFLTNYHHINFNKHVLSIFQSFIDYELILCVEIMGYLHWDWNDLINNLKWSKYRFICAKTHFFWRNCVFWLAINIY